MVHALTFFGGVPQTVLTDNMKTVILNRVDGQPHFHAKLLDFDSYHSFVPQVCQRCRPQTEGNIESTIRYIRSSFWLGTSFDSPNGLNRQALAWCEEASRRVHASTREIPAVRFPHEGLAPLNGQRQAAKDCLVSYRGNRSSVPHVHAGQSVIVRRTAGRGYEPELLAIRT